MTFEAVTRDVVRVVKFGRDGRGVPNSGHLLKIMRRRYRDVTYLDVLSLYVGGSESRVGDIQIPRR